MKKKEIFRILDANLNRAREGLRVCEDIIRFFLNHKELTQAFRTLRHNLTKISKTHSLTKQDLLKYRNSRFDVGRNLSIKKYSTKLNFRDLFSTNIQRSEEALRVLEEISKIIDHRLAHKFKKLRFKLYSLEAKTFNMLLDYAQKKH